MFLLQYLSFILTSSLIVRRIHPCCSRVMILAPGVLVHETREVTASSDPRQPKCNQLLLQTDQSLGSQAVPEISCSQNWTRKMCLWATLVQLSPYDSHCRKINRVHTPVISQCSLARMRTCLCLLALPWLISLRIHYSTMFSLYN